MSELLPTPAAVTANDPVGAVWRRWDPHIHTPGTALSDGYGASTLDDFLSALESASPVVEALGVTDYYLTRKYSEVVAARVAGRLPQVKFLFCNIEIRLTIETKAGVGVNMHLLVSPDDPDHVDQLNRFLSNLKFHYAEDNFSCTEADLRHLGRKHDSSIKDDEAALRAGVNQFKVDFHALRKLYEETAWARANILVAVAGSSNDGTAGLQDETASFAATRKEIESFAHIIFTATPKNIEFWRGEGALSEDQLLEKYRGTKPCLHGSDAHRLDRVAAPDGERRCWIKGDPTFESLRQACLEPKTRVSIGATPPQTDTPFTIESIATPSLPWLVPQAIPLNPGMIAIIGARGSGKTALADLIAHAGSSPFPSTGQQSFLTRASNFIGEGQVAASWTGSGPTLARLDQLPSELPEIHYLTQQFVDRLCSSIGQSDELLDEIKRVVFLAHDPASRLGAENFDALAEIRSSETDLAVSALNQRLDRLSEEILIERDWYLRQGPLKLQLEKVKDDLKKNERARQELIKPGGQERANYYTRLRAAIEKREHAAQLLERQLQGYRRLATEGKRYQDDVFPQLLADLKITYSSAALTPDEWAEFAVAFAGNPAAIVSAKISAQLEAIKRNAERGAVVPTQTSTELELEQCGLESLRTELKTVGEQIGVDQKNVQRLKQLNDASTTQTTLQQRLQDDLKRAEESPANLKERLAERAGLYERFVELVVEKCDILNDLYAPLATKLASQTSSAQKLGLRVVRSVDIESWGRAGERLLDLRKAGIFKGKGSVAQIASETLLPAWRDGSSAEVAAAMEAFRAEHDKDMLAQSAVETDHDGYHQWIIDLGRWLYSTDHIQVQYSIEYEGVPIVQLSPGTRGIVLLLLYLALDLEDSRPLIIDQPEENLDPASVFTELVTLFRDARMRRQVIIVTHNANLVVNTDVDQVIVASCIKSGSGTPPEFHYQSGGLEDASIRKEVCDILEGGKAAFRQRAARLRVSLMD